MGQDENIQFSFRDPSIDDLGDFQDFSVCVHKFNKLFVVFGVAYHCKPDTQRTQKRDAAQSPLGTADAYLSQFQA